MLYYLCKKKNLYYLIDLDDMTLKIFKQNDVLSNKDNICNLIIIGENFEKKNMDIISSDGEVKFTDNYVKIHDSIHNFIQIGAGFFIGGTFIFHSERVGTQITPLFMYRVSDYYILQFKVFGIEYNTLTVAFDLNGKYVSSFIDGCTGDVIDSGSKWVKEELYTID